MIPELEKYLKGSKQIVYYEHKFLIKDTNSIKELMLTGNGIILVLDIQTEFPFNPASYLNSYDNVIVISIFNNIGTWYNPTKNMNKFIKHLMNLVDFALPKILLLLHSEHHMKIPPFKNMQLDTDLHNYLPPNTSAPQPGSVKLLRKRYSLKS